MQYIVYKCEIIAAVKGEGTIISLSGIIVSLCLPKLPQVNECEAAAELGIEAFEQSGVCVCVRACVFVCECVFRGRKQEKTTAKQGRLREATGPD